MTNTRSRRNSSVCSISVTAVVVASACARRFRRCLTPSMRRRRGELDSVDKRAYWKVVDHCYLCDMCYMTKCPYVPPHPWNVDFPHLMLRAKAVKFREGGSSFRDRLLTSTDRVGSLAGIPVVAQLVNAANSSKLGRKLLDKALGVHPEAPLPKYHSKSARRRLRGHARATVRAAGHGRDPRARGVVHHLLRQSQRAGSGDRSGGGVRAQRHRVDAGGPGTLLRHAQARAGRSGRGRPPKGRKYPAAAAAGRSRATTSSRPFRRAC